MTVAVISTGGTIASTADSDEAASPELTADDIVAAVPGIGTITDLDTYEFTNLPSTHLTVDHLYDLLELVKDLDGDASVNGVVVTQGTDVLEETAFFVDLCYDGATPVVFTCAMRNPSLPSADGPANLLAAVRVASTEGARERGVLVVFNDRVHDVAEVMKMHSMNADTFRTPEFGPLAVVEEGRVTWRRRSIRSREKLDPEPDRLTNDVPAITVTADMTDRLLRAARDAPAVCLAATGAGHVPPGIVPALKAIRTDDVSVVVTTRCPEGRLARSTYGFEGSEKTLREIGCLYSDVSLQKTRMKAIAALAADAVERAFERP